MKIIKALLILFIIALSPARGEDAQTPTLTPHKAESLKSTFGVYVTEISNIDYVKGKFDVIFWAWWNFPSKDYMPQSTVNLENSKDLQMDFKFEEKIGNSYHAKNKISATVSNSFNAINFPFDKQTLVLCLTDANLALPQLEFTPDKANSGTDVTRVEGWEVTGFRIEPDIKAIDSNLGFSNKSNKTKFSHIKAYIELKRCSYSLFLTYFIGFLLAIIFCLVAFYDISNKLDYILGAIFSAVSNKLVLDMTLPMEMQISFSDKIQIITFSIIIATVILAIKQSQFLDSGRADDANRIKVFSIAGILVITFILIPIFILQAMEIL